VRLLTRGPEETRLAGFNLGKMLKAGQTVCLYGTLGSGKTTFIKGIARALGIDERDITSASFTIVSEHEAAIPLYHIDLYRVHGDADMETTGVYEYIGGRGIAVVEWAEKIRIDEALRVRINFVSEDTREIIIEGIDEKDWNHLQDRPA
jgi:tRNA threonylcarbamoyladenosine biosynthesis protein TsaE